MPGQTAVATSQRRNLILESIRRLSKTRSWVTAQDLAADLKGQGYDVRKHHVLRDLKALRQVYPELECHDEADATGLPKKGIAFGFRWVARDAIPETGLSIPEALSLVLVSRYLRQALPATLADSLNKLFERAETTLEVQRQNGAAHWTDLVGVVLPSQPMLPPQIDAEVIQVVHRALIAREQFRGVYRNAKGEVEERLLHPLGIMVREPAVYLIAVVDGYEEPRMFAMHRFQSAQREFLPANYPQGFSLANYLEQQGNFGMGEWITLKARVSQNLGMILEETPLGKGQRLSEPDEEGWRKLSVRVRDNWQLKWWILAQGERIFITEPATFSEKIRATINSIQVRYNNPIF